ncbi:MAG TPA: hypothetical protein VFE14_20970 [Micromonosporaceae bacterium]|jgi:hypothetical protein|nr:hypothetical protein [Micromonosporaceae bacterium]
MARRSAADIFRDLVAAGFSRAQAIIMTAIGLAESGGDDTAQGDLQLQDHTWGPSYGTYQIRTLKGDTGTGKLRDITALTGDDLRQAQTAYAISRSGADFTPWSVYTSGRYRTFLGQAQTAAANNGNNTVNTTNNGATQPVLGFPNPLDIPGDLAGSVLAGGRAMLLQLVVASLGLALVGVGLAHAFAPQAQRVARRAKQIMNTTGKVAAAVK